MLVRSDDRGTLLIGQPSHAWVSGQLARAWGGRRFGRLEPHEEVCLAAEQHDIGMAQWDLAPERNPQTGLPRSFTQMPIGVHLALWDAAAERLVRQSRYAALLVSMHGMRLYQQRDLDRLEAADADAIREFLQRQRQLQEQLLTSLRADPATAASADDELVARNSDLIWTWDFMSLALCLGWAPCSADAVPTNEGPVELQLRPGAQRDEVVLDPWPLRRRRLRVRCEGQRLNRVYDNDEELRRALEAAPWETLEVELRP
jgi:hypothetical protein